MQRITAAIAIAASLALPAAASAAPIKYDFTGSAFGSWNPGVIPNNPLSGSFTLDGANMLAIDLTIAGHTYIIGETDLQVFGGPDSYRIWGTFTGTSMTWGTDDFWIDFGPNMPSWALPNFAYTVQGVQNSFFSYKIDVTSTPVITAAVPEPGSYALMLGGLALLGIMHRRRLLARA